MLNRVNATPDQIAKITIKYVRDIKTPVKCSYDSEDDIYYFSAEHIGPEMDGWLQFQSRRGSICYCSLRKGQTSYDINYQIEDTQKCLWPQLERIAKMSRLDWAAGNQI